jgi:adenine-specific DNA-methyltransferase
LLRAPFADDSNRLDKGFYGELLHIIGLEERKEGKKWVIDRRKPGQRNAGSLMENAIAILETENTINKMDHPEHFGLKKSDQQFNIALELCITWVNRILFLKLLEAQLMIYHQSDNQYRFLNSELVPDFNELYKLFHQVLTVPPPERNAAIKTKYPRVPYLNSSLFEISELEDQVFNIRSLDSGASLRLAKGTILEPVPKTSKSLPTVEYIFRFLDAYDFAGEGTDAVQEESRKLINASVLGKVFEKINGYKDGSFFTPGFITMYICRQTIRLAILQKLEESFRWGCEQFDDLRNFIADRQTSKEILDLNKVVNTIRLCDPAVGSGHFLVSALNEIIAAKSELGILADEKGIRLAECDVVVVNDELVVADKHGSLFEYEIIRGRPATPGMQRVQETLFREKQTIIENCLFGVDINANAVKICRLRLWIELLKNAYYLASSDFNELHTLPNIDINIKLGNSLVSRFKLDGDMSKALKDTSYTIDQYRIRVTEYKNERNRDKKRSIEEVVESIKEEFKTKLALYDPRYVALAKKKGELEAFVTQGELIELTAAQTKAAREKEKSLRKKVQELSRDWEEVKNSVIYEGSFEWSFEFPEILTDEGYFGGFDVVFGNPPYVYRNADVAPLKSYFEGHYFNNSGNFDLYKYFIERAIHLTKIGGYHSFITNSSFLLQESFEKTREFFMQYTALKEIAPLGPNVFEEATVDSVVYIAQRTKVKDTEIEVTVPDHPSNLFHTASYRINQSRFKDNSGLVFDVLLNNVEDHVYSPL